MYVEMRERSKHARPTKSDLLTLLYLTVCFSQMFLGDILTYHHNCRSSTPLQGASVRTRTSPPPPRALNFHPHIVPPLRSPVVYHGGASGDGALSSNRHNSAHRPSNSIETCVALLYHEASGSAYPSLSAPLGKFIRK